MSPRRPELLRPVLLQHALEQRRAVRDHRSRPVPEPRRHRRVHHRVGRHRAAHRAAASRELGVDRMDTSVGPLSVEVLEGLRTLRVRCEANEWGISADLTFTGTVDALEEPRRSSVGTDRVIQDVTRYAQVGVWEGTITAAAEPPTSPPTCGRAPRPSLGGPPGRRARAPRHPGPRRAGRLRLPPRLAADAVRRPHAQGADRPGRRRQPAGRGVERVWNSDRATPTRSTTSAGPRSRSTTSGPRAPARSRSGTTGPDGDGATPITVHQHAAAHALPRRRFRLREPRRVGPRRVPGRAEGRGARARPVRPRGATQVRHPQRDAVPVRD